MIYHIMGGGSDIGEGVRTGAEEGVTFGGGGDGRQLVDHLRDEGAHLGRVRIKVRIWARVWARIWVRVWARVWVKVWVGSGPGWVRGPGGLLGQVPYA